MITVNLTVSGHLSRIKELIETYQLNPKWDIEVLVQKLLDYGGERLEWCHAQIWIEIQPILRCFVEEGRLDEVSFIELEELYNRSSSS